MRAWAYGYTFPMRACSDERSGNVSVSEGVLYIAVGANARRYLGGAYRSAISLREECPNVTVALVVNQPGLVDSSMRELFDLIIQKPALKVEDKLVLSRRIDALTYTPFDRTLCMDCDTQVCGDVTDVFGVLNHYDMAMVYAIHRMKRDFKRTDDVIPEWLPEFNGGVIVYRKSSIVSGLLEDWQRLHVEIGEWNDQMALRAVIWRYMDRYGLRIYPLPCEYNVWTESAQTLGMRARIIHGHKGLPQIRERINVNPERVRTWVPLPVADLMDWKQFHETYPGVKK
jgi:hypothetical protein